MLSKACEVTSEYVANIHRVLHILKELHEISSKKTLHFLVFEAGVLCTIILSPQCDEGVLSQHKAGLRMTCEDLQFFPSDKEVTMVINAASSATNIIIQGCLQAWAEANRQRLRNDRLGEPRVAAVVHLYTFYRLHKAVDVSSPTNSGMGSRKMSAATKRLLT